MADIPIAPGCELVTEDCGCDGASAREHDYCATHQDPCDTWPCAEQQEYERTSAFANDVVRQQIAELHEQIAGLRLQIEAQRRKHYRLAGLVEHALMPFMRDAMPLVGGSLQISDGRASESESLKGWDRGPDGARTFSRARLEGTYHGITYWAADGRVWHNGTVVPTTKAQPTGLAGKAADDGQ